ncbi:MAG: LamG domain-containing protein, partial [Bacteroidia bacterium]
MKTLKPLLLPFVFLMAFSFPGKTFAQAGAGLDFDGANDQVNVPNSASLNITGNITLEAWVYATKNSGVQNTMCKSSNSQNTGYIFPRTDDGWAHFIVYLHIAGAWRTLSAPYGALNQWHHLAATWDGTNIRLYKDGVLVATSPNYSGLITSNTNQLTIGQQPGYSEYFGGQLDECRIWNVARTQCDIYTYKDCEIPTSATGLVANYHFNEGVASSSNSTINTLTDASGNANDGTLANFALSGANSNWIAPTGVVSGSVTPLALPNVSYTATNPVVCGSGTTA